MSCALPGPSARPDRLFSDPAPSGNWASSSSGCGSKRILVVTDATLVEAGLFDEVQLPLRGIATLDVYTGGEPEPSLHTAEHCIAHGCANSPPMA